MKWKNTFMMRKNTKWKKIKNDFPELLNKITYLDSTFTSFTPNVVLRRLIDYYSFERMSPTGPYESLNLRLRKYYKSIANFLNTNYYEGLIITKSCTEAINYFVNQYKFKWKQQDNIIISEMEYAPAVLPWFRLQQKHKFEIRVVPVNNRFELDIRKFRELIDRNTRFVSIIHVSNLLGIRNPIEEISLLAKSVPLFVDAAQSVGHINVDIQELGCKVLTFSGHKSMGPTGTGVLWVDPSIANSLHPFCLSDSNVIFKNETEYAYNSDYRKFWGGFVDFAGIAGLVKGLEYLKSIGIEKIRKHNTELLLHLINSLRKFNWITMLVEPDEPISVLSFYPNSKITARKLAKRLWDMKIIIQLLNLNEFTFLKQKIGIDYCIRVSVHCYNDIKDIEKLVDGLRYLERHI